MANRWMCSFDWVNTGDLAALFSGVSSTTFTNISANGRTGKCIAAYSASYAYRNVPACSRYTMGQALKSNRWDHYPDYFAQFCSGATAQITFRTNANRIEVRRGGYNGTVLGTGTSQLQLNAWEHVQTHVYAHPVNGRVEVRLRGASTPELVLANVNTDPAGTGLIDRIFCVGMASLAHLYVDDVWMNDDTGLYNTGFSGDCRIRPIGQAAAVGDYDEWDAAVGAATKPAAVAYPPDGDTSYVPSDVVGARQLFRAAGLADVLPAVRAARVTGILRKSDLGNRNVRIIARRGAVDASSADSAVSDTNIAYSLTLETDPSTGNPFQPDAFDGSAESLQYGAEVRP